jgi:hypothetical protein
VKVFAILTSRNWRIEGKSLLTRSAGFEIEIDRMTRNLQSSYDADLKKIRKLKARLNSLEQEVGRESGSDSAVHIRELNRTTQAFNSLSDSLIRRSKKASQKLKGLEHRCKSNELETNRLSDLLALCKKTELMAADLLCYTLGSSQRVR